MLLSCISTSLSRMVIMSFISSSIVRLRHHPPYLSFSFTPPSLSNHIRTPLSTHPNLMPPPRLHIQPASRPKRLLRGCRIIRVRHRQLAAQDQVRGKAGVRVRWVVGVAVGKRTPDGEESDRGGLQEDKAGQVLRTVDRTR